MMPMRAVQSSEPVSSSLHTRTWIWKVAVPTMSTKHSQKLWLTTHTEGEYLLLLRILSGSISDKMCFAFKGTLESSWPKICFVRSQWPEYRPHKQSDRFFLESLVDFCAKFEEIRSCCVPEKSRDWDRREVTVTLTFDNLISSSLRPGF